jgi:hypothetical protein
LFLYYYREQYLVEVMKEKETETALHPLS